MSKYLKSSALVSLLVLAPCEAFAEWDEQKGWYGRVGVGFNATREADITVEVSQDLGAVEKKGDISGEAAIGFDFKGRLRGEVVYHREFDGMEGGSVASDPANDIYFDHVKSGAETSFGANAYVDFRRNRRVSPFIGIGAGVTSREETRTWDDQATAAFDPMFTTESASPIYVQAETGVGVRVTDRWTAEADVTYRYTGEGEYVGATNQISGNLGVRRKFGKIDRYVHVPTPEMAPEVPVAEPLPIEQPLPAAVPEPTIVVEPPVAKPYVPEPSCTPISHTILFDLGSSEVSRQEQERLDQLAANPSTCLPGHLKVVGHTDTFGDNIFNDTLALRRANAVKEQLMIRGVENAQITLDSFGEKNLAVPTADGVKNRENRRVTIQEMNIN